MRISRCDLMLALAPFRRRWGTVTVVTVLLAVACALSAANSSVFLFFHARPLPYANSDRVVVIGQLEKHQRHATLADNLTLENYVFVREHADGFERVAGSASWRTETLRVDDAIDVVDGAWVSPGYFEVLGIAPLLGATFTDPAVITRSPRPLLLSHELWVEKFNRDASVLNRTVWLNDRPHVVVGVMPAGLRLPGYDLDAQPHYWAPLNPDDVAKAEWRSRWYPAFGLREPGVSVAQAQAGLDLLTVRLREMYPEMMKDRWLVAVDLKDRVVGTNRRYFNLLLVTTALLSGLVLVNVVNLLVAQLADRSTYFATAGALGATRAQILRPLVIEHVVLWVVAVMVAVPFALGYFALLSSALGPAGLVLPRFDLTAFGVTAIGLLWLILITMRLAVRVLQGRGRRASGFGRVIGARSRSRMDGLAIATQAGLAVTLLVVCALLAQSIGREAGVNRHLPLVRNQHAYLVLRAGKYAQAEERLRVFLAAKAAVQALPEVERVGLSYYTHPSERTGYYQMIDDRDPVPLTESPKRVIRNAACSDYLATAGLSVVAGRGFTEADLFQERRLMVVSQRAAAMFWPGEDPIGRRILIKHRTDDWAEVIGVVQDIAGQRSNEPLPLVWRLFSNSVTNTIDLLIQTRSGAPLSRETLQRALDSVDPEIGIATYEPVATFLRRQRWLAEAMARLSTLLALIAAVVCGFGVFSILNRRVGASLKEIALRKALGAQVSHVLVHILQRDLTWIVAGVVLGGIVSMLSVHQLFDTGNLRTYELAAAPLVGVAGVLFGALLGAAVPLVRAAAANLALVLRND